MLNIKRIEEVFLEYYQVPGAGNYTITPNTGVINVNGDLKLKKTTPLGYLPPLVIDKVTGNLYICYKKLNSLKYSPRRVMRYFDCRTNNLTDLEGGPLFVGGVFICWNNPLDSFLGNPEYIKGILYFHFNPNLKCMRIIDIKGIQGFYVSNDPGPIQKILEKYYRPDGINPLMKGACALEFLRNGYRNAAKE
jgi:hypothetical protein